MIHSEAHVRTDTSQRYAKQLCHHAGRMGAHATWTPPTGVIEFPHGGSCQITAHDDTLELLAEADTAEQLATIQAILSADLQRFGQRGGLHVTWSGGPTLAAPAARPKHWLSAHRHIRPR